MAFEPWHLLAHTERSALDDVCALSAPLFPCQLLTAHLSSCLALQSLDTDHSKLPRQSSKGTRKWRAGDVWNVQVEPMVAANMVTYRVIC